jgi:hypothetical protein
MFSPPPRVAGFSAALLSHAGNLPETWGRDTAYRKPAVRKPWTDHLSREIVVLEPTFTCRCGGASCRTKIREGEADQKMDGNHFPAEHRGAGETAVAAQSEPLRPSDLRLSRLRDGHAGAGARSADPGHGVAVVRTDARPGTDLLHRDLHVLRWPAAVPAVEDVRAGRRRDRTHGDGRLAGSPRVERYCHCFCSCDITETSPPNPVSRSSSNGTRPERTGRRTDMCDSARLQAPPLGAPIPCHKICIR